MPTPLNQSLDRALGLLAVVGTGPKSPAKLAAATGLPPATVHRLLATLERRGFVLRPERGAVAAGPALLRLVSELDRHAVFAAVARPAVRRLARRTRGPAQLGILESDMVTYLVKEGAASEALFTREGMQLEAYCSGLGKVLLAALPQNGRERYLAGGPFVALTGRTVTDPALLAAELERTHARDFATDEGEVDVGLSCVAVPVRGERGEVLAALSISTRDGERRRHDADLAALRGAAAEVRLAVTQSGLAALLVDAEQAR